MGCKLSRAGLTRSTLRWITLSFAGKKEGQKQKYLKLTLFTTRRREGRQAKQRRGGKICARQFELLPGNFKDIVIP
jgi:hypothetical protein